MRRLPATLLALALCLAPAAGQESPARGDVIPGLMAHCYLGINFDSHANSHVDPVIDFRFNGPGLPQTLWEGGRGEQISVRWVGYLRVTVAGKYLFQVVSDDGVRLLIDDAAVFTDWTDHGPRPGTATLDLKAGWHRLRIDYYQGAGAGTIQLAWQPPSTPAPVIIPASALAHTAADEKLGGEAAKPSAPAEPQIEKRPAPDAAAQRDVEKIVRDIFKADYAKTAPADRSQLVQKLMKQAGTSADDPAARYVLLREARDVAAANGDIDAAVGALDEMAKLFVVDVAVEKSALLLKLEPAAKSPESAKRLAERMLEATEQLVAADDFDGALKLAGKAEALAKTAKDVALAARSRDRNLDLQALRRDADGVKAAQATLSSKPDDPAANLVVGRFTALVKGDWEKALPALAKGSDPALKNAAEKDLATPTEVLKQVEAGDNWWDLAEKEKGARAKANLISRARLWYDAAMPTLSGLSKLKVEQRLAAAAASAPSRPAPAAAPAAKGGSGPVDDAVQKGVEYLKARADAARQRRQHVNVQISNAELTLLALLKCGVSESDPAVQALFTDMMERKLEATYAVALQAIILEELDRVKYQWRIAQCAQALVDNQSQTGQWSYSSASTIADAMPMGDAKLDASSVDRSRSKKIVKRIQVRKASSGGVLGDASNSIYAALGLRACHDSGILLPKDVLAAAEKSWRDLQKKERGNNASGWCYGNHLDHKAYGSVTAGALSALIIYDYIKEPRNSWKRDNDVQEGINWLTKNYSVTYNPGPYEHAQLAMNSQNQYFYYMDKLEGAGVLFGAETLGTHNWYAEGSEALVKLQASDGSWGTTSTDTPMALLFLRKHTRPFDAPGK